MVFYGESVYGPSVLAYFVFVGFMIGLFTSTVSIVQVLKDYKTVIFSLFIGVLLKFLLNDNLLVAFYKMGLPAYYGVITASLIGYFVSFLICIIQMKRKYHINYEEFAKNFIDILCGSMLMVFVLFLVNFIVPDTTSRGISLIYIILYTGIGGVTYFIYMYRFKVMKRIFGSRLDKWIKKNNK